MSVAPGVTGFASLHTRSVTARILCSVQIVSIEVIDQRNGIVVQGLADGRVISVKIDCIPVVDAAIIDDLLLQLERDHTPGGYRFDHLIVCIYVIIGDTIAHDETLEVVSVIDLVHFFNQVPLVNLPSEIGYVDSGIRLSSDVQIV
jgi:hypothetical protein